MGNNQITNEIFKYIDLRYRMIRDYNKKGVIKLNSISAEHNIADIMTKTQDKANHRYFTAFLLQVKEIFSSQRFYCDLSWGAIVGRYHWVRDIIKVTINCY